MEDHVLGELLQMIAGDCMRSPAIAINLLLLKKMLWPNLQPFDRVFIEIFWCNSDRLRKTKNLIFSDFPFKHFSYTHFWLVARVVFNFVRIWKSGISTEVFVPEQLESWWNKIVGLSPCLPCSRCSFWSLKQSNFPGLLYQINWSKRI